MGDPGKNAKIFWATYFLVKDPTNVTKRKLILEYILWVMLLQFSFFTITFSLYISLLYHVCGDTVYINPSYATGVSDQFFL